MYSSRITNSNDSDQFASMICSRDNDYTVTERGSFKAQSTWFALGRLEAQQASESLCRISHFECSRVGIVFLTDPGPGFVWNGAEVGYDQVGAFGPGVSCFFRLQGATKWASVSLTKADIDALCVSHLEDQLDWMTRGIVFYARCRSAAPPTCAAGFRTTSRGTPSGVVSLPRDDRSRTRLYSGAV